MVFAQPHVHDSVNALDLCEIVGIAGSLSSWSYAYAWFGVSRYDKKSYIARCHIGFARRRQPPDVHSRPSSSVARRLDDNPPSLAGRLPPWTWALTGSNAWYTMFGLFVCFLHVGVCVCRLACAILQEGNEEQLYVLFHFIWWKYGRNLDVKFERRHHVSFL